jgi:hypothetical protein
MSLKVRAILVIVIGVVMGLSLSVGGGLISDKRPLDKEELAWEQARLFAEVLERVKHSWKARFVAWSATSTHTPSTSMPASTVTSA